MDTVIEKKEIVSLNTKILETTSIEELEERFEFATASSWSCSSVEDTCSCVATFN